MNFDTDIFIKIKYDRKVLDSNIIRIEDVTLNTNKISQKNYFMIILFNGILGISTNSPIHKITILLQIIAILVIIQ